MATRKERDTPVADVPPSPDIQTTAAWERHRLVPWLPYLAFAVLLVLTWRRWILPFQDSGREVMTAARLADGERLYAEVSSWYGPLPNHLDAFLFRAFGKHLDVLIALRLVLALLAVEGMRRLVRRLVPSNAAAAVGVTLVVCACFFLRLGGAYMFPYCIAALEGMVGVLWSLVLALGSRGWPRTLAAAFVAGFAAGTKLEFLPAAVAGLGVALFFTRPRLEAITGTVLASAMGASAFGIPILLLGREQIESSGFLIARDLPREWRHLYGLVFWAGGSPSTFPVQLVTTVAFPAAVFMGLGLYAARRVRSSGRLTLAAFLLAGIASAACPPGYSAISGLVPFALGALARDVVRAARRGELLRPSSETASLWAMGAAMLPLVARQPFSLLPNPYSAFSGPLPLAIAFAFLFRILGPNPRFLAFVLGLACAQVGQRTYDFHRAPMRRFDFARGSFYLYDREGILLTEIVSTLKARTPEGSYVAVFPESGMVLFLADRKNPFVDEQFLPGMQDEEKEAEMIRRLDERRPAAAVLVNRSLHEYGARLFGFGYLERFRLELERRMSVDQTLGKPDRSLELLPFPARADEAYFLVPAGTRR